jgi:hypothetical protein
MMKWDAFQWIVLAVGVAIIWSLLAIHDVLVQLREALGTLSGSAHEVSAQLSSIDDAVTHLAYGDIDDSESS